MSRKVRLDVLLVERGLCPSRSLAQAMILAGKVRSGTERLTKAGQAVPVDLEVEVETPPRFVSRAGEKLEGFLSGRDWDVSGLAVLDIGASTGGFTDCLLQRGAAEATCVDVGHGQIHPRVSGDPRVTNFEGLNARELDSAVLPRATYHWVVMDLSFISLRKVLVPGWNRLEAGGLLIALVKPQFEAERREADAGKGIIRDDGVRLRILHGIREFIETSLPGAAVLDWQESTVAGTEGNREFLIAVRKNLPGPPAGD